MNISFGDTLIKMIYIRVFVVKSLHFIEGKYVNNKIVVVKYLQRNVNEDWITFVYGVLASR